MTVVKKYVVYELNRLLSNNDYLTLQKVNFSGMVSNSFDTEEEAIQALINDKKRYEDFIIAKQVYIK